jgi:hypothetical protein
VQRRAQRRAQGAAKPLRVRDHQPLPQHSAMLPPQARIEPSTTAHGSQPALAAD